MLVIASLIDNFSKDELEQVVKESSSMAELIDKIGYSTHSGSNRDTVRKRLKQYNIDVNHFGTYYAREKRCPENIFVDNSTASQATLREWYKNGEYSEYKCSICGLEPIWMNKSLTLILDHKNGKNKDHRLQNLRWVCPNCNQQLDKTGFKNYKLQHNNE